MEAAARLAAQRKAAEQAARQQVEAEMQKKRADRQSRVYKSNPATNLSYCINVYKLCSVCCISSYLAIAVLQYALPQSLLV